MAGKEANDRLRAALRRWVPRCEEFVRGARDDHGGAPWLFVFECARLLSERDAAVAEAERLRARETELRGWLQERWEAATSDVELRTLRAVHAKLDMLQGGG